MELMKTIPGQEDRLFGKVPGELYPPNSLRLRESEDINPDTLVARYTVCKTTKPVARAALYQGKEMQWDGKSVWMVGNYECTDDEQVAGLLFERLFADAKAGGADYLIGPMNGSTWNNYRFSLAQDFPNFLLEPYHHLYYVNQFYSAGFEEVARYVSNVDTELACDWPELLEKERAFAREGVQIRSLNVDRLEAELDGLYPFIDVVFRDNRFYMPISREHFKAKYLATAPLIDRDYVLVAENPSGHPVGFVFSYDDKYSQRGRSLVIKTLARAKEKPYAGLGHVLANRVIRLARARGYRSVVHAFIVEQGDATRVSGNFTGRPYKKYVLLGKYL
mgnify:CR=1 FL=1